MVEEGAVSFLKNCQGCFLVRNDMATTEKGFWVSGYVSDVTVDGDRVVIHLFPAHKWDKKPPVEVPLNLISEAHKDSEARVVHIHAMSQEITIEERSVN